VDRFEGVVVVGGGAVGLTIALALAQREVPVKVLEAAPALVEEYRASTFHPPTIEMLDGLGLAAGMIDQGLIADKLQYRDRRLGKVAEFDFGLLRDDTPYPFRLQIEQYVLAKAAYERLIALPGASVEFECPVSAVEQDADEAILTIGTASRTRQLSAPYVIGADGGTSAVRHSLDIAFEGMTYEDRYLVVFTKFPFHEHLTDLAYVNYVSDPREWFVLLRSPGLWRVLFPVQDETADAELTLDAAVQERLQGIVASPTPYPVIHRTPYRVHQRVAATYRKGRVLLAGDAAHVNNPLGGMGLNGGIHDAVRLSQALSGVWHRTLPDGELDAYSDERRGIALAHVQAQTKQNAAAISQADSTARERQQAELRETAADPVRAREYLLRVSMITGLTK
jgi:3-(3-hydroxy-phenyl)propionate hydroxylase